MRYQGLTGGQWSIFESFGTQAVDIFFVLSGFVIAHVCATREADATRYAVSRLARIYSVALPALLLTVAADAVGRAIDASVYTGPFQPMNAGLWLRSLLFLGEQWNAHRFPGSNGPYWSLGFEVWYYVAFGVFMFAPRQWRWAGGLAVLLFIGPKVSLMFPAWLVGIFCYALCRTRAVPTAVAWVLLLAPVAGFMALQVWSPPQVLQFVPVSWSGQGPDWTRIGAVWRDFAVAVLFGCHILGYARLSDAPGAWLATWLEPRARAIRWIAGATFSLYLAHLPIMHLLATLSPWPRQSPATPWLLLAGAVLGCFAFAECGERRKALWHRLIETVVERIIILLRFRQKIRP